MRSKKVFGRTTGIYGYESGVVQCASRPLHRELLQDTQEHQPAQSGSVGSARQENLRSP